MRVQDLAILQNTNSYDGTFMQYKGFWKFNSYYTGASTEFLHMKTNINTVNMWLIEAVGYNYSQNVKVRSTWGFHWDGSNFYSLVFDSLGGYGYSVQPQNIYRSADGYVVLVAYSSSWGYCGFMLNAYNTADVYNQSGLSNNKVPQITASAFSGSDSGVY